MEYKREEYEKSPPYDDQYTGQRFKYGYRNRPYGIAHQPKGSILMTYKPDDKAHGSRFGTIEYPFPLTENDITSFELIDFQKIKNDQDLYVSILHDYANELKLRDIPAKIHKEQFWQEGVNDKRQLWLEGKKDKIITRINHDQTGYNLFYSVTLKSAKPTVIKLDAESPEDLQESIRRGLKWLDKEIATSKEQAESLEKRVTEKPLAESLAEALDCVSRELMNERVCRGLSTEEAANNPSLRLAEMALKVHQGAKPPQDPNKGLYEALKECQRVIQAHIADPQTLAGREGTKALNMARTALAAVESQATGKKKGKSQGMER